MKFKLLAIFLFFTSGILLAQKSVTIDVNLDVKHTVGDISEFDRNKFIVLHADVSEQEWDGSNLNISDLRDDFLNGYDVYMGRNTGGITWNINNNITEDPSRTGFADPNSISTNGQNSKNNYASTTNYHSYESRNDQVMCAQLHPFWPDGQTTNKGWAFSQTDSETEPFGTATGEYMARYMKDFFGTGGTTGQPRPNYVEIINEPLWHLTDYGTTAPEKVFRFHNAVANEIKKYNDNIQVGGYCVAFPDLEKNNFQQWEERWKLFMDIAGENMDFWSIHLYDFPTINNGQQRYRKGAQMEATLDMIEHYSFLKFGVAKPFLISEYGAQMHDYKGAWSPYRDWLHVKSCNSMMIQFMQRPQNITKAINFLPIKAEWGYNASTGATYDHRLMRKENEPTSYTGSWVYTDMVKLYQLWKNVKGTRVDSRASNQDILTDTYVDGNKVYVIINSLDIENSYTVNLNLLGLEGTPNQYNLKHLYLDGSASVLKEFNTTSLPETFEIGTEGTIIIECTYADDIAITGTSDETKYYATELLKPIFANTDINFAINDVTSSLNGEAVLRIGIGRDRGKEIYPEVTFNGINLTVDKNYKGGDSQEDRSTFFGVLEVNIPYDLIASNNDIKIKFPDAGGYISSVSMQVYNFSREIDRFAGAADIKTIEGSGIKIFPNPAKEYIALSSPENITVNMINIIDLKGCKVLQKKITGNNQNISVSSFSKGIYYILLNTDKGQFGQKLLIH